MVVDLDRSRSVSTYVYQDFMKCHIPTDLAGCLNTLPVPISRIARSKRDLSLPMMWTTLTNPVTCCDPTEELMDNSCLSIRGRVITLTLILQSSWSQLD